MNYQQLYEELRALADEYRRLEIVAVRPMNPHAARVLNDAGLKLDAFLEAHPENFTPTAPAEPTA